MKKFKVTDSTTTITVEEDTAVSTPPHSLPIDIQKSDIVSISGYYRQIGTERPTSSNFGRTSIQRMLIETSNGVIHEIDIDNVTNQAGWTDLPAALADIQSWL